MHKAAVLIISLVIGAILGIFLYSRGLTIPFLTPLEKVSISGNFDINGEVPEGSTITLTQKEEGSDKVNVVADKLPANDKNAWSFGDAIKGKTYVIQAELVSGGEVVVVSSPLMVTAPADEEVLTLNVPSENGVGGAVVSGEVVVNGFIPGGSTITIQGRKLGSTQFVNVATALSGKQRQFMSYATAVSGTTYEVRGVLLNSQGQNIGTSDILTVTAPATDEHLTINSEAQAPESSPTQAPGTGGTTQPSSSAISGSINFNGQAPSNSRIVIFQQTLNSGNNQVAVDNISPTDGTTWTWNGAQGSTWYTLFAVLKQRNSNGTDTDIATSAPITVAAPATNVIFSINSGVSLAAPGGPISVSCQTYNDGPNQNNWNVQVSFPSVTGAQSYWYQIGSTNGASDLLNTTGNAETGSMQTQGATFNNNTTYYARYAYANIANVPSGSTEYSPFSSATPIQCGN